jgi:hypothetical protein
MVYFVQGEKTRLIKIGRTNSLMDRLTLLQTSSPDRLICLAVLEDADDDRVYHNMFADCRVHFEWFEPNPPLLEFIAAIPVTQYTNLAVQPDRTFNCLGHSRRYGQRRRALIARLA